MCTNNTRIQALLARKKQLQADIRREAELIDQYKVGATSQCLRCRMTQRVALQVMLNDREGEKVNMAKENESVSCIFEGFDA